MSMISHYHLSTISILLFLYIISISCHSTSYMVGLLLPDKMQNLSKNKESILLSNSRYVSMTDRNNNMYNCYIPNLLVNNNIIQSNKTVSYLKENHSELLKEAKLAIEKNLLKAFNSKKLTCIYLTTGYWTYEVCPFLHVLQFHMKFGKDPSLPSSRDPVILVGNFSAIAPTDSALHDINYFASLSQEKSHKDLVTTHLTAKTGTYANQHFSVEDRVASVYYSCTRTDRKVDKDKKDTTFISYVGEAKPHNYVFIVSSPYACFDDKDHPIAAKTLNKLMKPLIGQCATLNAGWWRYDFCFLKHVRQYHLETAENGSARVTVEYVLGSNQPNTDGIVVVPKINKIPRKSALTIDSVLRDGLDKTRRSYLSFNFYGGTHCDIEKLNRSSEVRIFCDEAAGFLRVDSVEETTSCQYLVKVSSKTICEHASFAPVKEPVNEIVCLPRVVSKLKNDL